MLPTNHLHRFRSISGSTSIGTLISKQRKLIFAELVLLLQLFRISAASPPNIVIVVADDMGFSDAGCYGGEIHTPTLDWLAAHGLRFTQFYNTTRCWPTRASLLTGYYAQQVRRDQVPGVKSGMNGRRPVWAPLLQQLLRSRGYRSYHSGKWHLDGAALEEGFDRSYRVEDTDNYFHPKRLLLDDQPLPAVGPDSNFYVTDAIGEHAINFLREHHSKYSSRPFFLYLCFTAPHFPLQAPAQLIMQYTNLYQAGWDVIRNQRHQRQINMGLINDAPSPWEAEIGPPYKFPQAFEILGPGEVQHEMPWRELTPQQQRFQAAKMAIHAAMIEEMDKQIGRVVEQIKAMGVLDDTLIFFLSDNGASAEIMVRGQGHDPTAPMGSAHTFLCLGPGWSKAANTPFRRHKTWVHEGGIATPLIVCWLKGIEDRGAIRRAPGHVIDIAPTVLEVAGLTWPLEWRGANVPEPPGRSLVPLFRKDLPWFERVLWWLHEGNRALRIGNWKIVADRGKDWELYDLAVDRSETQNLATKQPERVKYMAQVWEKMWDNFQRQARESN